MSRRNKHTVFGMDIELFKDGKVNIGMQRYTTEAIKTFGEGMAIGITSLATSRLFDVTEGADKVLEEKYVTFHSTVAKLFWVMKMSRPYIEMDISFLYNE